jgi:hypothetical protein
MTRTLHGKVHGKVHGKTIELEEDLGVAEEPYPKSHQGMQQDEDRRSRCRRARWP